MGWLCVPDGGQPPSKASLYSELPNAPRPIGRPKLRFRDVLKRDPNAFSITSRGRWGTVDTFSHFQPLVL